MANFSQHGIYKRGNNLQTSILRHYKTIDKCTCNLIIINMVVNLSVQIKCLIIYCRIRYVNYYLNEGIIGYIAMYIPVTFVIIKYLAQF